GPVDARASGLVSGPDGLVLALRRTRQKTLRILRQAAQAVVYRLHPSLSTMISGWLKVPQL
ncbi:hypothetical protein, partial [Achromobacter xylosoxidans]|uniref:hypothetical protein n=1 Tax=Alcaligenes xylosoxydans xylosoxydans TaxID=85698 RepID=UPI001E5B8DD2